MGPLGRLYLAELVKVLFTAALVATGRLELVEFVKALLTVSLVASVLF